MQQSTVPTLAQYGTKPDKPGLYLGLFHGRHDARDEMLEWGFDGPLIGPLDFVHTTYAAHIKLQFESDGDAKLAFGDASEHMLTLHGDLILFKDKYYGDWTVFYVSEDDCASPQDRFREMPRMKYPLFGHMKNQKSSAV